MRTINTVHIKKKWHASMASWSKEKLMNSGSVPWPIVWLVSDMLCLIWTVRYKMDGSSLSAMVRLLERNQTMNSSLGAPSSSIKKKNPLNLWRMPTHLIGSMQFHVIVDPLFVHTCMHVMCCHLSRQRTCYGQGCT